MTVMTVFEPTTQRVHRETLKMLSKELLSRYSVEEMREILNDSMTAKYLGYTLEKETDLLDLLIDLSKWKNEYFFLSLLDYLSDIRMFNGAKKKAVEASNAYLKLLKNEGFDFGAGRWWISPHASQAQYGDDRYRNSSGDIYECNSSPISDNLIKSVTIVRPGSKEDTHSFYVNGNVQEATKISKSSKSMADFIVIAESESQSVAFDKGLHDYINYDRRNVLYKNSGCSTTQIFVRNGDRMSIGETNVDVIEKNRYKANVTRMNK